MQSTAPTVASVEPRCQTVNIIGVLTVPHRAALCKIVNKQHDGAPLPSQGENVESVFTKHYPEGAPRCPLSDELSGNRKVPCVYPGGGFI